MSVRATDILLNFSKPWTSRFRYFAIKTYNLFGSGSSGLRLGTTNRGKNPTRDPLKEFGNTPTGEATVTVVVDLDPKGRFVASEGKPVDGAKEEPSLDLKRFGRFFIRLEPESGALKESGRTGIGIHGGGSGLGISALEAQQPLKTTQGCLRCTNQTAAQLSKQVIDAKNNNRVFRVIIRAQQN